MLHEGVSQRQADSSPVMRERLRLSTWALQEMQAGSSVLFGGSGPLWLSSLSTLEDLFHLSIPIHCMTCAVRPRDHV